MNASSSLTRSVCFGIFTRIMGIGLNPADAIFFKPQEAFPMDYDELLELVKSRRSIRKFKPDPIPDEIVDKIIEAARFAPSAGNSQPWEFIVIRDPDTRNKIVEFVMENKAIIERVEQSREWEMRYIWKEAADHVPGFKQAPVFILVCGDRRISGINPVLTTLTRGDSHFDSNLSGAFLYMSLAISTLGLGSERVSATGSPIIEPLVRQLLKIPPDLDIYHMCAIGYPEVQPQERYVRDREEMVHDEIYDMTKYRSDEEIRNYILRHRERRR
jgi:nitroreductase